MAEVLALNIVLILVLLLIVGPFVARAVGMARQTNGPGIGGAVPQPTKQAPIVPAKAFPAAVPRRASPTVATPAETPRPPALDDIPQAIVVEKIEGTVEASSVKRVGAIIKRRPREAASVISAWLSENGA